LNTTTYHRPWDYYVLWLVALASLGLNLYIINGLLEARRQVGAAAHAAADGVSKLHTAAIDYAVDYHNTLPISLTVSYQQTMTVPVSVTLPINTSILVPLRTPIGTFPLNFPVITTVPISFNTTVPLSIAIPISLTVPVDVAFPIHIAVADTPFGATLDGAADYLRGVAEDLNAPLIVVPPDIPTLTPPVSGTLPISPTVVITATSRAP